MLSENINRTIGNSWWSYQANLQHVHLIRTWSARRTIFSYELFLQNNHFYDNARPETLLHLCNFDNKNVAHQLFSLNSLDTSKSALLKLYFKCLIISRYACAHCEQCLLSLDWISTRQIRPQLIFVPGQMPQTIIIRCRRHFFALLSSCLLRPGSWEFTKMLQSKSETRSK